MISKVGYLGGADQSLLQHVSSEAAQIDSDGDPVIWDDEWNRKFHQWGAVASPVGYVILLFSAMPSSIAQNLSDAELMLQFAVSDQRPAPGAYLLGKTITTNAWKIPNTDLPYQEACKELIRLKFGNVPCVVLWNNANKVVCLPNGFLGSDSNGFTLPAKSDKSPFDKSVLCAQIELFSEDVLAAEDVRGDLWERKEDFWPIKRAERAIQKVLLISLRSVFGQSYKFDSETPTAMGDIDVRILPKDSLQSGRAVIELKVIKQFGSTGGKKSKAGEVKWLMGGITQALAYDPGACAKYLCAFDMRKDRDQAMLAPIQVECKKVDIEFLCYEVFASAEQVRKAVAAKLIAKMSSIETS